jgi:F-type H+-transporting ATPase subunit b
MININYTYFFQIMNILILFFFLRKYLFNPVMAYLDRRNDYVQTSLKEAEHKLQEANALYEKYNQEMAGSRKEGREIIERARLQGEELKEEILGQAKEESDRILVRAREEIQREKDKAQSELRKDVATLSVLVASKILKDKIDDDLDQELVDRFIREAGELK